MKSILNIKKLYTAILVAVCSTGAQAQFTTCAVGDSFAVRIPHYKTIDLVCGNPPSTANEHIVFCAPAAFSALIKPDFADVNIAGWHYANGALHKGYPNRNNNGGFVYCKNGNYDILNKQDYANAMQGDSILCSFEQCLVVYRGEVQSKFPRGMEWVASYRSLCSKNNRLFFFETTVPMTLERYLAEIKKQEVDDAVYMEMGQDYNHTWWRNEDGTTTTQFPFYRGTNWVVFKD